MPPLKPSTKVSRIYHSLPPEAQKAFLEDQLFGLLDTASSSSPARVKQVVSSASKLQRNYATVPSLDLRGKKREIGVLLETLKRDSRCSLTRERSIRGEIIAEIMDSLVSWLSTIWRVTYEHRVHFMESHKCLLYAAEIMSRVEMTSCPGGCQHRASLHKPFSITNSARKTIKRFYVADSRYVNRVLLWLWRELFLTMSLTGHRSDVPTMMEDIEESMGWPALERLLYGGVTAGGGLSLLSKTESDLEQEDFDEYDDSECVVGNREPCSCPAHALHWSEEMNEERHWLRKTVRSRLIDLFDEAPSIELYLVLLDISRMREDTESLLLEKLSNAVADSSDNLMAALRIYTARNEPDEVLDLIDDHSYLIRPRDSHTVQNALLIAAHSGPGYSERVLSIAEVELTTLLRTMHASVQTCFGAADEPARRAELLEILRLRAGSVQRSSRLESWVQSVTTTGTNAPMNPMAFAAMMFGIPAPAATGLDDMDEPADLLSYLDLMEGEEEEDGVVDPDPGLEELREEFRPRLRARWNGWVDVASAARGGSVVLAKLYQTAIQIMPYLRSMDACDGLISALNDRPSKLHVSDAIDALALFAKAQRDRAIAEQKKKDRRARKAAQAAASSSSSNTTTTPQFTFGEVNATTLPNGSPFVFPPLAPVSFGGLDDVD